jgi:hypothetical protein
LPAGIIFPIHQHLVIPSLETKETLDWRDKIGWVDTIGVHFDWVVDFGLSEDGDCDGENQRDEGELHFETGSERKSRKRFEEEGMKMRM